MPDKVNLVRNRRIWDFKLRERRKNSGGNREAKVCMKLNTQRRKNAVTKIETDSWWYELPLFVSVQIGKGTKSGRRLVSMCGEYFHLMAAWKLLNCTHYLRKLFCIVQQEWTAFDFDWHRHPDSSIKKKRNRFSASSLYGFFIGWRRFTIFSVGKKFKN